MLISPSEPIAVRRVMLYDRFELLNRGPASKPYVFNVSGARLASLRLASPGSKSYVISMITESPTIHGFFLKINSLFLNWEIE